ncbi:MAG: hypothetical protein NWR17_03815 [Candidatus Nanopelagicales bacterium]|jgi:hypothetical protein|nr:hypothetical protein [Candidatus Nanopelagicales bacterium]
MAKRTLAVSLGFAADLVGGTVVGWLQESSPIEVATASVPETTAPTPGAMPAAWVRRGVRRALTETADWCQDAQMTPRARLATAALAVGMILTPLAGCSQNDQNQNQNQNQNQ